jgi:deoxyribose-phosphate aldolase
MVAGGVAFEPTWFMEYNINMPAVKGRCFDFATKRVVEKQWQAAWLLKAVSCIELTCEDVKKICERAAQPISQDLLKKFDFKLKLTAGAVCVATDRIQEAVKALNRLVPVTTSSPICCKDIEKALQNGVDEIDVAINTDLIFKSNWKGLYDELCQARKACGAAKMVITLPICELGSLTTLYRAAMVSMMAGADFIKTPCDEATGLIMARAIREFNKRTGVKVGLKAVGGVKTAKEALEWLVLVKEELGDEWLQPQLFRIGCCPLLLDIESQLGKLA